MTGPAKPLTEPGRFVRYKHQANNSAPIVELVAMIVFVHDMTEAGPDCVNLTYWDINGFSHTALKVKLGDGLGEWAWPKYIAPASTGK